MKTKQQKYDWIIAQGQKHEDWPFYNQHKDLATIFKHKFLDQVIKEIKQLNQR